MEKTYTKRWQRVVIFIIAILFILTSATLTIFALVDNSNSSNNATANESQQAQNNTNTTKLAGTKEPNYTPEVGPMSKLTYRDVKVGTGQTVTASDTVTADYTGWLAKTGVIFDGSVDHGGPQTFPLSGVIPGWTQGIPGMKVGGTRELMIPASLAYGATGQPPTIPPNSDLVFDVTIVSVSK